jgi:4-amino-4-deoxy-L-arabinose transferase-like glycosyltransferase
MIAPVLFLLHPGTLIAESRGGVEMLFTSLITLFIVALYRAIDNGGWREFALAGGVLGVTVLVRSTPIMFPVFLLAYMLIVERGRTRALTILRNVGETVAAEDWRWKLSLGTRSARDSRPGAGWPR